MNVLQSNMDRLQDKADTLSTPAKNTECADHSETRAYVTAVKRPRWIMRHCHTPIPEMRIGNGAKSGSKPHVRYLGVPGDFIQLISVPKFTCPGRAKSVEKSSPWRHLKGISIGDSTESFAAFFGPDAPSPTVGTIYRPKTIYPESYEAQLSHELIKPGRDCNRTDRVCFTPRLKQDRTGLSVVFDTCVQSVKEIIDIPVDYRESTRRWREQPLDLLRPRPENGPVSGLAVGNGAPVFWQAFRKEFCRSLTQIFRVRKIGNILNRARKNPCWPGPKTTCKVTI